VCFRRRDVLVIEEDGPDAKVLKPINHGIGPGLSSESIEREGTSRTSI
jgi:hypothetical protein